MLGCKPNRRPRDLCKSGAVVKPSERNDVGQPTWSPDLEFAWAVGLFEGEGCISPVKTRSSVSIRLTLASTDEDVVRRFALAATGNTCQINGPHIRGAHYKPFWKWEKAGIQAETFLKRAVPFLGERRTARALEVLAQRDQALAERTAPRICPGCNREFLPLATEHTLRTKPRIYCSDQCQNKSYRKGMRVYAPKSR